MKIYTQDDKPIKCTEEPRVSIGVFIKDDEGYIMAGFYDFDQQVWKSNEYDEMGRYIPIENDFQWVYPEEVFNQ